MIIDSFHNHFRLEFLKEKNSGLKYLKILFGPCKLGLDQRGHDWDSNTATRKKPTEASPNLIKTFRCEERNTETEGQRQKD